MKSRQVQATALILLAMCGILPADCLAHARWLLDGVIKPRSPASELTTAPCGGVQRTTTPVVLTPGQTVNVEWEETIDHPGYYIISFSPAADASFDQYVLAPKIIDTQDGTPTPHVYRTQITLPDQACAACTLQLIQVMEENPQNPVNYYSCADIQLAADPGGPPSPVTDAVATPENDGLQLTWKTAPNSSTLVLLDTEDITARPTDGTRYAVGQTLGTARVVYQGTGTRAALSPLPVGTMYYFSLVAFDNQLRYAAPAFVIATRATNPTNQAPVVTLRLTQRGRDVSQVAPDGGEVVVSTQVRDPDSGEQPTYDWSLSDNRLVDEDSAPESLTLNPRPLPATTYVVSVTITDNGVPAASATASLDLVVTAPSAPPAPPEDPAAPGSPTTPGTPTQPGNPTTPVDPPGSDNPTAPGTPTTPGAPTMPNDPTTPTDPPMSGDPATPSDPPLNPPAIGSPTPTPDSGGAANVIRETGSGALPLSLLWCLVVAALNRQLRAFPTSPSLTASANITATMRHT